MLAVEVDLLEFLSAHFLHMPASFAAVFRVWSDLHPEPHQRELLLGLQGTLERNNAQRLEDAWFARQAVVLSEGHDADIAWDLSTPAAFDCTLCSYTPILRKRHFASVLGHISDCPRCQRLVALITDGKHGARRRVCANLDCFTEWPELQVALQTGCLDHADSNHIYCLGCRQGSSTAAPALASGVAEQGAQKAVLSTKVMRWHGSVQLGYVVEFCDGSRRLLRRGSVDRALLVSYEGERAARRPRTWVALSVSRVACVLGMGAVSGSAPGRPSRSWLCQCIVPKGNDKAAALDQRLLRLGSGGGPRHGHAQAPAATSLLALPEVQLVICDVLCHAVSEASRLSLRRWRSTSGASWFQRRPVARSMCSFRKTSLSAVRWACRRPRGFGIWSRPWRCPFLSATTALRS